MDLFNDNFRENLASSLDYKPAPVDNNIRPPTGETWQQAGMTQYRGYYYEITNVTAGLGMGDNYTYALYPPEAADSAFFNYSSVMRVQGDFRTRGDANTAVRAWVDGLIVGSSDPSDTGDNSGIGIPGLLPGLPDALQPDDTPSTTPSEDPADDLPANGADARIFTEDQKFLFIGVLVAIGLIGFIQKRGT